MPRSARCVAAAARARRPAPRADSAASARAHRRSADGRLPALADCARWRRTPTIDLVVGSWNATLAAALPGVDRVETLDARVARRASGERARRCPRCSRAGRALASAALRSRDQLRSRHPEPTSLLAARGRAADGRVRQRRRRRAARRRARLRPARAHGRQRAAAGRRGVRRGRPSGAARRSGCAIPDAARAAPRRLVRPEPAAAGRHARRAAGARSSSGTRTRFARGRRTRSSRDARRRDRADRRAGRRAQVDRRRSSALPADRVDRPQRVGRSARRSRRVIEQLDLFVTGDTGPMHLANAVGTPIVAVFGPSDPARYAPRGPRDRVVRDRSAVQPVQPHPAAAGALRRAHADCLARHRAWTQVLRGDRRDARWTRARPVGAAAMIAPRRRARRAARDASTSTRISTRRARGARARRRLRRGSRRCATRRSTACRCAAASPTAATRCGGSPSSTCTRSRSITQLLARRRWRSTPLVERERRPARRRRRAAIASSAARRRRRPRAHGRRSPAALRRRAGVAAGDGWTSGVKGRFHTWGARPRAGCGAERRRPRAATRGTRRSSTRRSGGRDGATATASAEAYIGAGARGARAPKPAPGPSAYVGVGPARNFRARRWWHPLSPRGGARGLPIVPDRALRAGARRSPASTRGLARAARDAASALARAPTCARTPSSAAATAGRSSREQLARHRAAAVSLVGARDGRSGRGARRAAPEVARHLRRSRRLGTRARARMPPARHSDAPACSTASSIATG